MKTLELNQMENLQGGDLESCLVGGLMAGVNLSGLGPWGFLGGFVVGCTLGQMPTH